MVVEDQSEVAAFLADPRSWGVDRVERIDTHGAMVFLAGDRAYKLKRAVKFPFMDFSTLALRERACAAELRVNRRTAPQLYLGTARVTRETDGLAIDGKGPTVDWLVVMQRFEQDRLLDRIAARGALDDALAERVACAVAAFHASVDRCEGYGRSADIAALIADVDANMAAQPALDEGGRAALIDACARAHRTAAALIDERQRAGLVRWCHGDLHMRNICVLDSGPTLFDAIEFNDSFCCTDTLYDLAFLVSDLSRVDLRGAASRVLNRYLEESGDWDGVPLLPLFLALRAGILAYTLAASAQAQRDPAKTERLAADARRCLALGQQFLVPQHGRIVAVGGLSGTGKSTTARALAPALGRLPGAVILRSDVLRKRRAGVAPTTPLGPEHYGPGSSEAVYRELRERAVTLARAGQVVVVDAVFAKPAERDLLAAAAREAAVDFAGFWLDAPPDVAAARVAARRGDASDATVAVVDQQRHYDVGRIDWRRIDAGQGVVAVTETLRRELH